MRKVVNSEQVAHLWANQSQPEAYNGTRSVSFKGRSYFSYRTIVARIVDSVAGSPVALFTTRHYSVTTAKHVHRACSAARHLPRFTVPEIAPGPQGHADNLRHLCNLYTARKAEYLRATGLSRWGRTDRENVARWLNSAALEAQSYAAAFGLTVPEFPVAADVDEIMARFERLEARRADPKHQAKLERARERRAERQSAAELESRRQSWDQSRAEWDAFLSLDADNYFAAVAKLYEIGGGYSWAALTALNDFQRRERERLALIRNAESVRRWRAGENVGVNYNVPTMLRVKSDGATVQTSRGAEVPLRDAARLYALVAQCRARGEGWRTNGHTFHVGAFTVSEITATGDLTAGCHSIAWPEIEAFAIAQGWASSPAPATSPEISGEGAQA